MPGRDVRASGTTPAGIAWYWSAMYARATLSRATSRDFKKYAGLDGDLPRLQGIRGVLPYDRVRFCTQYLESPVHCVTVRMRAPRSIIESARVYLRRWG